MHDVEKVSWREIGVEARIVYDLLHWDRVVQQGQCAYAVLAQLVAAHRRGPRQYNWPRRPVLHAYEEKHADGHLSRGLTTVLNLIYSASLDQALPGGS